MVTQRQTGEDIHLVKYYMIYPVVLDVLRRNVEQIESGNWKLPDIFITHLKLVQRESTKNFMK